MNPKVLTAKQVEIKVKAAVNAGTKAREAVHSAVQATVMHAWEHGDVTLLNRLIAELPKGMQLEKLRQYILEIAPVRINKPNLVDTEGTYKYKGPNPDNAEEIKAICLNILSTEMWWEYKVIPKRALKNVTTGMIFERALKNLIKNLQEHTDLNPLEMQALEVLHNAVKSREGQAESAKN